MHRRRRLPRLRDRNSGFFSFFFFFPFFFLFVSFCCFVLLLFAHRTFPHQFHFQKFLGKASRIGLVNEVPVGSNLDHEGADFTNLIN